MVDDDFRLLVEFRDYVPGPTEEIARRTYALATAPSRAQFARRLRRRAPLAAAAVLGVMLIPALAFGGRLLDIFEGTPAPPQISTVFADNNQFVDSARRDGFAAKFPRTDVSLAHGVIQVQTSEGPEELWVAPNDRGGDCWFVDFASDPPGPKGMYGFGGCDTVDHPTSGLTWGDVSSQPHPSLVTVFGRVYVDAATVKLTLSDGSTKTFQTAEGFFLVSLQRGMKVTEITAFDRAGNSVATDAR